MADDMRSFRSLEGNAAICWSTVASARTVSLNRAQALTVHPHIFYLCDLWPLGPKIISKPWRWMITCLYSFGDRRFNSFFALSRGKTYRHRQTNKACPLYPGSTAWAWITNNAPVGLSAVGVVLNQCSFVTRQPLDNTWWDRWLRGFKQLLT